MAQLTVDELVAIVCEALDEIGLAPEGILDDCGDWEPEELELGQPTLVRLFARIDKKVKARGRTVVLGKTMWRKSKSVRAFCEAVAENLE
jgi:hypothetical protein